MKKLQPVRGTHDLLPEEFAQFQAITSFARSITSKYGFKPMATPIFEFTDVFARTMGESSDVVNKEMYTFEDRGGESITLRPEFTAGVVRALISNGMQQDLPLKLFASGPVFRYERPQKGRQRQFHQISCEHFGNALPIADADVIAMADDLLNALKIESVLHINSLGDGESRAKHREDLVEYLTKFEAELSEDSKNRLRTNPLRILDSKDENDRKICLDAPKLADCLNAESRKFFDDVLEGLEILGIEYVLDNNLVRGLDYYNHTVFEFKSASLGAQDTILAGGRYDGLVKQMGGPDCPAVGWGAGIERLMLLTDLEAHDAELYMLIAGAPELKPQLLKIAQKLRAEGKVCEIAHQNNIGKAMKFADKKGASYAVIYGEDEAAKGVAQLKNLKTGVQEEITL